MKLVILGRDGTINAAEADATLLRKIGIVGD